MCEYIQYIYGQMERMNLGVVKCGQTQWNVFERGQIWSAQRPIFTRR